jgi:APA family basic amino acid/polyamine antiporter
VIMLVLILYRTETTWPGLLIVLTGIPVYYLWHGRASRAETAATAPGSADRRSAARR